MSSSTRVDNSKKNAVYGLLCQAVIIVLSFINRQIFVKVLGEEYLGINGLFSNILTVLSLAEMGIGNTFLFFLYKPIREHDYVKLQALLAFSKKLFHCVVFGILVIGSVVIPLLPFIVDADINMNQIRLYYILYLLNSAFSYFSVDKSMILEAYQKNHVTSLCKMVIMVFQNAGQIIILIYAHDYLLYLSVQLGCTVLYNIYITYKALKMFPFISTKLKDGWVCPHVYRKDLPQDLYSEGHVFEHWSCDATADSSTFLRNGKEPEPWQKEKKHIWEMIKSTFVYKAGVIMMNNTDNILISIIITTAAVGYYSNYKMIEMVIASFINVLIRAITASLGDLNAENNKERSLETFKVLLFLFHIISAFCSICLLLCVNDFIFLWIGKSYLLGIDVVVAMVFCFYISNIITPVWVYRETMGLYRETKYLMLIAAIINLVLSIVLGILFGLSGIIIATGLARILTTVWYEPKILFNKKFGENVNTYYFTQMKYIAQTLICVDVAYLCTFHVSICFLGMLYKVMMTCIIVIVVFVLFNRKTKEYMYVKRMIRDILSRCR